MKEIYMHESEMPKGCMECQYQFDCHCDFTGNIIDFRGECENCPVRSLEAHDKEVEKQVVESVTDKLCLQVAEMLDNGEISDKVYDKLFATLSRQRIYYGLDICGIKYV